MEPDEPDCQTPALNASNRGCMRQLDHGRVIQWNSQLSYVSALGGNIQAGRLADFAVAGAIKPNTVCFN
jgi:hypothetical protein